jgi:hypothetical protein
MLAVIQYRKSQYCKLPRGRQESLLIQLLAGHNFLTGSQTYNKLRRVKALAAGETLGRKRLINLFEGKLRAPDHPPPLSIQG